MAARKSRSREKPTKGLLEVTVHDSDGQPRPRLRVQLLSGRTELAGILTDADGVAEFPDLALGEKYFVRINGDESYDELLMERAKESLEIEYEGEAVRNSDDEEEAADAEDEEEDLDSLDESAEELG